MRNPLRTSIRQAGGRTLAAASLAGVIAVTGTTAQATTAEPITPTTPPVLAPVEPALATVTPIAEAPAFTADEEAAAVRGARAMLARKTAEFQTRVKKVRELRNRIVDVAKDQIGDPYRTGSAGPNAFDCSGLVRYVYKKATGRELPHQSRSQYAKVRKISKKDARPGDLVFFFRNGAHHVGVYIGGGKMVHAKGVGRDVSVSPISGSWYSRTYSGMGRLIEEPQAA